MILAMTLTAFGILWTLAFSIYGIAELRRATTRRKAVGWFLYALLNAGALAFNVSAFLWLQRLYGWTHP